MKKVLVTISSILGIFLVFLLLPVKNVSAQGTFSCHWVVDPSGNLPPSCQYLGNSCESGYKEDSTLCAAIATLGQSACDATQNSPLSCVVDENSGGSTQPGTYTCTYNSATGSCVANTSHNCNVTGGYVPGTGCSSLAGNPGSCTSNTEFTCVVQNTGGGGGGGGGGGTAVGNDLKCSDDESINTAIGCIPFGNVTKLAGFFLRWALGFAGGIALLLIGVAGFQMMTSSGDPRKLQAAKELLSAAVIGLILLIFSVFILRVVGVDILGIIG